MTRSTYILTREPVDDAYRALVTFCARHATEIIVVVRQPEYLEPSAQEVVQELERLGASHAEESEWPGTKLLRSGLANVYHVPITPDSVELMTNAVDRLYAWVTPRMPDDLSFVRSDGDDILASISHEDDAYLTLSGGEYAELQSDPVLSSLSMELLDEV